MKRRIISILITAAVLCGLPLAASAAEVTASIAPSGIAMVDDTLYIADSYHRAIWSILDGETELLTGRTDLVDLSGRPLEGYHDAPLAEAVFGEPWDIVAYREGFLVSDRTNHVIRYVDLEAGTVETALGTGRAGKQGGYGVRAAFDSPTGVAVGEDGEVFIADTGNHRIRLMAPTGKVTTYAGAEEGCALGSLQQARFREPTGLCYVDGVLYVADSGNHRIVAIADGQVTLVAGAELTEDAKIEGACLDGAVEEACFSNPQGIAAVDGTVYVADTGNGAIRIIQDGRVSTILSIGSELTYPVSPRGLLMDEDTLYVGDVFSRVLLELEEKDLK